VIHPFWKHISAIQFYILLITAYKDALTPIIVHNATSINESAWPSVPDQSLVNGINILLITSRGPRRFVSYLDSCNLTMVEGGRGGGERERERELDVHTFCTCTRTTVCGLPWMTIRYSFPAQIITDFTDAKRATQYTRPSAFNLIMGLHN